jgi:signal peptidase II
MSPFLSARRPVRGLLSVAGVMRGGAAFPLTKAPGRINLAAPIGGQNRPWVDRPARSTRRQATDRVKSGHIVAPMVIVPADAVVRRPGIRWAMCAIGTGILAADQVSKNLVLTLDPASARGPVSGWLTVHLIRNTGASGGIGAAYPTVVTLAGVIIAAFAGTLALHTRNRAVALCLAAVLAGAAGNLADRVFRSPGLGRGAVVDWIHVGGSRASFNLADLAIQLGALGTVIAMFAVRPGPGGRFSSPRSGPN